MITLIIAITIIFRIIAFFSFKSISIALEHIKSKLKKTFQRKAASKVRAEKILRI
jgi:hypothetical protein